MLSDRQNSSYAKSTENSIYIILINIERVSKHSVTIRGLRVVTTCWSWAWSNRTSPSKWIGLGSPLAACSVYGDLTCSVHTVNNLCMFNCQCHFYLCNWGPYVRLAFVPNMLSSWNKDIIIIIITFSEFYSRSHNTYELPHDKTNKMTVRPAKTQISLGIRPVWSESSLSVWRKLESLATHWAHSEDSDQTGRMPRLIWVF